MPIVQRHHDLAGPAAKRAYIEREIDLLLDKGLVYYCPDVCETYHMIDGVTDEGLMEVIYEQVKNNA
jgi:hypothetical protein